ncbi:hypothetical protein DERP_009330 [Dermatophagoides pteronyssinus]|uniref:Uncharacterized protein n=1 Tax=Dermatophagoides pteronyssinus TaxID=6956 RepID=A0ABQ8ITJ3_DERPT|nr:hypothetical protein DERP_009330 [Dermatophagoides pteronyssinus]
MQMISIDITDADGGIGDGPRFFNDAGGGAPRRSRELDECDDREEADRELELRLDDPLELDRDEAELLRERLLELID